jgi:hypothetical protein
MFTQWIQNGKTSTKQQENFLKFSVPYIVSSLLSVSVPLVSSELSFFLVTGTLAVLTGCARPLAADGGREVTTFDDLVE